MPTQPSGPREPTHRPETTPQGKTLEICRFPPSVSIYWIQGKEKRNLLREGSISSAIRILQHLPLKSEDFHI
jgi:putative component of membrane protein insertase Oxa1/YidC/SpoIIIJ protein YidD